MIASARTRVCVWHHYSAGHATWSSTRRDGTVPEDLKRAYGAPERTNRPDPEISYFTICRYTNRPAATSSCPQQRCQEEHPESRSPSSSVLRFCSSQQPRQDDEDAAQFSAAGLEALDACQFVEAPVQPSSQAPVTRTRAVGLDDPDASPMEAEPTPEEISPGD